MTDPLQDYEAARRTVERIIDHAIEALDGNNIVFHLCRSGLDADPARISLAAYLNGEAVAKYES